MMHAMRLLLALVVISSCCPPMQDETTTPVKVAPVPRPEPVPPNAPPGPAGPPVARTVDFVDTQLGLEMRAQARRRAGFHRLRGASRRQRYTAPAKLAAAGISTGGVLVGRALTERPDLFAAVWLGAPIVNPLRIRREPEG
jgi:hypothetical protein